MRASAAETLQASRRAAARLLLSRAAGGNRHSRSRHARQSNGRPRALLSGQSALRPPPPRGGHPPVGTQREARRRAFPSSGATSGIGYFNIRKQPAKARAAYDRAFKAESSRRAAAVTSATSSGSGSARSRRSACANWTQHLDLVQQRDDLSVELCALYNQTGRHDEALATGRPPPVPAVGRRRRRAARPACPHPPRAGSRRRCAQQRFPNAPPTILSRPRPRRAISAKPNTCSPTRATSITGSAAPAHRLGEKAKARQHWRIGGQLQGRLPGNERPRLQRNDLLLGAGLGKARPAGQGRSASPRPARLRAEAPEDPAKIDYFATSLPTMLLFDDDLQLRQETTALFLQAQARLGLGEKRKAQAAPNTCSSAIPITRSPRISCADCQSRT